MGSRGLDAHPMPDVPVTTRFGPAGQVVIRVEVDPRCFTADPLNEPYLTWVRWQKMKTEEKETLQKKALLFISENIEFRNVQGVLKPSFSVRFTTFGDRPLKEAGATPNEEDKETPVMLTAEWETNASNWQTYQVKNGKRCKFSVPVLTYVSGTLKPKSVLFPGEESRPVEIK